MALAGGLVEGEDALLVRGDVAAHVEALHRCGGGEGSLEMGLGSQMVSDDEDLCSLRFHAAKGRIEAQ